MLTTHDQRMTDLYWEQVRRAAELADKASTSGGSTAAEFANAMRNHLEVAAEIRNNRYAQSPVVEPNTAEARALGSVHAGIPPIFESGSPDAALGALVVQQARAVPRSEVLVVSDDSDSLRRAGERVEHLVNDDELVPGRGGISHRPLQIRLANGSRIVGRLYTDPRSVAGVHCDLIWWASALPVPEEVRALIEVAAPELAARA
jgi:hypothetical protein